MIIYLHGFASSKNSHKAQQMQSFQAARVIAEDLDAEPVKAVEQIELLIRKYQSKEPIMLMGSSLGGYYALCMAKKFDLPAVLINPSIYPYETLSRFVGVEQPNYSKNGVVVYEQKYIEQLKAMDFKGVDQFKLLLMLQTGDESLDYQKALDALPEARHYVEKGGNHAFEAFETTFELIEKFYKEMIA